MLSTKSRFTNRQLLLAVLLLVLVVSVSATGLLKQSQNATTGQGQGPQLNGPILGQSAVTPSSAQATEIARQAESTLITKLPDGGEVHRTVKRALSPAARTLPSRTTVEPPTRQLAPEPKLRGSSPRVENDPALQTIFGPLVMPPTIANFDGIYNYWGGIPPDTVGDVGRTQYVQMVNVGFQVYSKATGSPVTGVIDFNELYKAVSFGGECETQNAGDPIVVYDQLADRWLLSQFTAPLGLPSDQVPVGTGPYFECIAISATGDASGAYYLYAFQTSESSFEDYPHFGVWPDAYYMSTNEAPGGAAIVSAGFFAFERDKMLVGDPTARMIYETRTFPDGGFLPSDLDGYRLPPAGSPNFYMTPNRVQGNSVREYKFQITTWDPTPVATLLGPFDITVDDFDSSAPGVPQPGNAPVLDSISDRFMNRVAYRNMGTYESLVVNHTVNVVHNGTDTAGIRWYEFRDPNNALGATVFQQGTFSPPDGLHRWMGSAAMDGAGNIALGYSVSSSSVFPSIRYTGRLSTDPLGDLTQGEATLKQGSGSQTETIAGRWGDYSSLNVDTDDCTFWYTQEYYAQTGLRNWRTRIGSFKMPNCVAGSTPTAVPSSTGTPPTATRTPSPSATSCPNPQVVQGSIDTNDPMAIGRLSRDGVPSSCGTTKTCPAIADQVARHYETKRFYNTSLNPQCMTVHITSNCGDNALLSAAYVDDFNPDNQCENYLGDMGSAGPDFSYSFTVPAGRSFVVAVLENSANVGCANYTISVNQCNVGTAVPSVTGTPPTATPSPTRTATATATSTPCSTNILMSEDFETGTLGVFTSTKVTGDQPWTVSNTQSHTGTWSAHVPNNDIAGDEQLVMKTAVAVPNTTNPVLLQFYHTYEFETIGGPASFDGGVLEYSTDNGGTWTDALTLITEGGYNSVLGGPSNPLTGRPGWGSTSAGYPAFTRVTVDLSSLQGMNVMFRWRHGSDESGNAPGWYVDDVRIIEQLTCGTAVPGGTGTPTVTATVCPIQFQDVPQSTDPSSFYPYVRCLACRGIVSGYPCGSTNPETGQQEPCGNSGNPYYRPSNQITRGQISKIVAGASGASGDPGPQRYEDVPPSSPFYQWINRLSNEGVMGGYPCGGPGEPCHSGNRPYFRPGANASRGQMSKIVSNAAGFNEAVSGQSFEDLPPSNSPSSYYQYVERLYVRGVVSGYPCGGAGEPCRDESRPYFRPNNPVTRGQAAKIAANTFYPNCQTPARR
ncbi:MAG: large repetitive protein [Chloroflexia bacterium]|jgi:hypothetical protein|nr:large repetitive protein [Chloroflexia bacterium]